MGPCPHTIQQLTDQLLTWRNMFSDDEMNRNIPLFIHVSVRRTVTSLFRDITDTWTGNVPITGGGSVSLFLPAWNPVYECWWCLVLTLTTSVIRFIMHSLSDSELCPGSYFRQLHNKILAAKPALTSYISKLFFIIYYCILIIFYFFNLLFLDRNHARRGF